MVILQSLSFDLSNVTNSSIVISLVGYSVVFTSLLLLYGVFKGLHRLINAGSAWSKKKETPSVAKESSGIGYISGETNAAIALALHLYFHELHDEEAMRLTINRTSKRYTPWSSKIYGVIKDLNRRF